MTAAVFLNASTAAVDLGLADAGDGTTAVLVLAVLAALALVGVTIAARVSGRTSPAGG